jgi:hypothetical protein
MDMRGRKHVNGLRQWYCQWLAGDQVPAVVDRKEQSLEPDKPSIQVSPSAARLGHM